METEARSWLAHHAPSTRCLRSSLKPAYDGPELRLEERPDQRRDEPRKTLTVSKARPLPGVERLQNEVVAPRHEPLRPTVPSKLSRTLDPLDDAPVTQPARPNSLNSTRPGSPTTGRPRNLKCWLHSS